MIVLSAEEAGLALRLPPLETDVRGVSTDTRSLRTGDLFVALSGERFDGHDYVEAALEAGACGAVVERGAWDRRRAWGAAGRSGASEASVGGVETSRGAARPPTPAAAPRAGAGPLPPVARNIYVVDDTLEALARLAGAVRRKSGVLVLAVTGSAGKTSTKDILGAMVARVRRVVVTAANQNNEIGVPLTLLQIEPDTQAIVVEMGMRGRGQIASLARVAEPDVGVITNIHPVHLELLGSLQNIAEAKAELVRGLRPGGVGVVPACCEPLEGCLDERERRLVRFAVAGVAECPYDPEIVGAYEQVAGDVQMVRLRWPEGEVRLEVPPVAPHTLENLVAAAAACYAAGLPMTDCVPGFLDSVPGKGRGEILDLPGICLIDDTYNANPAAVRAAIDHLMQVAERRGGRAVAVLGDMRELGDEERRYHHESGAYAAGAGVQALWGVGPLSEATADGFRAERRPRSEERPSAGHVGSPAEISAVAASLRSGDVVLFKASRGVRLEEMVEGIAEQARAGRWANDRGVAGG